MTSIPLLIKVIYSLKRFPYPCISVPLENYQDMRKHEYILHKKGQDENVVILEGIIDYLKYIGDSYMVLDEEERILVHKIWGNVASSIHFYISAIAYEQRPYVMQHYDSFDSMHII